MSVLISYQSAQRALEQIIYRIIEAPIQENEEELAHVQEQACFQVLQKLCELN